MSDESAKEVTPLRLKRPVAPVPGPGAGARAVDSMSPLPSGGLIPPASHPAGAPAGETTPSGASAALPLRRRPTMAAEAPAAAPAGEEPRVLTGGPLIGALPEPAAVKEPAASPIKLRVGAKPAPPPPEPLPPMADPFQSSDGAPLVPLPGLPAMGSLAHLPHLPGQQAPAPSSTRPPMGGTRPQGTVQIGTAPPGSMPPGYKLGSADAPLLPLGMAGTTRPPMPMGAKERPAGTPPPLPGRRPGKGAHSARRDLMFFVVIFLVVGALGAGGYFYMTKPKEALGGLAEVKESLKKAAEMPGKAMDNAKDSMANARDREQSRVDGTLEGKDAPEKRGLTVRTPGEIEDKLNETKGAAKPGGNAPVSGAKPDVARVSTPRAANEVSAVVENAPGPTNTGAGATPTVGVAGGNVPVIAALPAPNARFLRFAEGVSVSGVFQGSPARALIDGRILRSGDLLEPVLGIQFVGVDSVTKHLILQDTSGAQVRVKY